VPDTDDLWGDYWAETGPEGCAALLPDAARGAVEAAWRECFAALPPGAAVLDVASGKGAVLRVAAAVRADLDLVGVDLAPDGALAPTAGLRLMGGVDARALPFADGALTSS